MSEDKVLNARAEAFIRRGLLELNINYVHQSVDKEFYYHVAILEFWTRTLHKLIDVSSPWEQLSVDLAFAFQDDDRKALSRFRHYILRAVEFIKAANDGNPQRVAESMQKVSNEIENSQDVLRRAQRQERSNADVFDRAAHLQFHDLRQCRFPYENDLRADLGRAMQDADRALEAKKVGTRNRDHQLDDVSADIALCMHTRSATHELMNLLTVYPHLWSQPLHDAVVRQHKDAFEVMVFDRPRKAVYDRLNFLQSLISPSGNLDALRLRLLQCDV